MKIIFLFLAILSVSSTQAFEVYHMTGTFDDIPESSLSTQRQEEEDGYSTGTFKEMGEEREPANFETEIQIESEHVTEITGTFE